SFTLFMISPQLALLILILFPVSGLLIGKIGRSLKKVAQKTQVRMGRLMSYIEETIFCIRIIKAFTAENSLNERFKKANNEYSHFILRKYRKKGLASPVSEFLGVLTMTIAIWYGGSLVLNEGGGLSAPDFIFFIALFSQILPPAKSFTNSFYSIQRGIASFKRVEEFLSEKEKIFNIDNSVRVTDIQEAIEYKDVTFRYDQDLILDNINLKINKGETIALAGRSGAGKSTLVDLLPRFYEVDEGEISIDGVSIKKINIGDLRGLMGIVSQESILFNDTVHNNIALGIEDTGRSKIIESAKIANAHEFIEQLENGYDTYIGERGNKLSGGQKQRVTIARAILQNPSILILDEATSSLDTESENLVQEALEQLMKDRTTFVIAHRLSTIQNADRIIVLDKGKIVETGDHNELIDKNGVYKKLTEIQSFG
ncbi:MAG: ABC transporter ATP-binding protein, partial [Flavobacteriales bacterium]